MAQLAGGRVMHGKRSAVSVTVEGIAVLAAVVALVALSFAAHSVRYFDIDLAATRALQSIHVGAFDTAMHLVGAPGYPPQVYAWTVFMLVVFWLFKMKWESLMALFGTFGIGAVGLGIKILVDPPRPTPDLVNVMTTLDAGKQSFPAGHVQSYVVILGFLFYLAYTLLPKGSVSRWIEMLVYGLMIALIGVSRVYVGEHWLSDVVGAYLLGGIWLWLTIRLYEWGKTRFFKSERRASGG